MKTFLSNDKTSYIQQGDCLELMKEIPDGSVGMVLCDLPYGVTALAWDRQLPAERLWGEYNRVTAKQGSVVLFASGSFEPRVMCSNIDNYKYKWVWIKNNSTNFVHAKNRPMTKHESILVFSNAPMGHVSRLGDKRMTYNPQGLERTQQVQKQGSARFGSIVGKRKSQLRPEDSFVRQFTNYPVDVLTDFPDLPSNKKMHTNQKPVALLEYLIKTYTNEGDVVLDSCMGVGSTCVAAINTNRRYIGFEIDMGYFEIAKQRIKEAEQEVNNA